MSELLIFAHFHFFSEWCEWIAHFAQIKWAMWANGSFRSPKMRDEKQAICSEIKWANSQPCLIPTDVTNSPMPRLWYCKKRQKCLTLRARLRYLENSDQCKKWTSCSSLYDWSWSKNWGQSLTSLTLTELSKYRNFAANRPIWEEYLRSGTGI